MIRLLLVVMAFLFNAAALRAQQPVDEAAISSVVMQQHECFWGTCPHYVIAMNSDGSGAYIGPTVAKTRGAVVLQLEPSSFQTVVNEINDLKFFQLKDRYASEEDGCKRVWSDQSSVAFFVT